VDDKCYVEQSFILFINGNEVVGLSMDNMSRPKQAKAISISALGWWSPGEECWVPLSNAHTTGGGRCWAVPPYRGL